MLLSIKFKIYCFIKKLKKKRKMKLVIIFLIEMPNYSYLLAVLNTKIGFSG